MTDAEKAAAEILEMLRQDGVTFVHPILFKGLTRMELDEIKQRIRQIIDRHMC